MGVGDVHTLISLDRFARIVGVHPMHLNSMYHPVLAPVNDEQSVGTIMYQYDWQMSGQLGRESVAEALAMSETRIAEQLHYSIAPHWVTNETYESHRGLFTGLKLNEGYFIAGGIEVVTRIALNQPIVYSDLDNDGYAETATVTYTTTDPNLLVITDPDEIAICYPNQGGNPLWNIDPTKVVLDTTVAGMLTITVTLRRDQLPIAVNQDLYTANALDAQIPTNVLSAVDLFRHYNDTTTQAVLDPLSNCDATPLQAYIRPLDRRVGTVRIAIPHECWGFSPGNVNGYTNWHNIRANLSYQAGLTRVKPIYEQQAGIVIGPSRIQARFERAAAYYALSLMDRSMGEHDVLRSQIAYWREDLGAILSSRSESVAYRMPVALLDCPLGTTRGAINAWRLIQRETLGEAITNVQL